MSEALLDAAREVFARYGVRRANVEDVARAAGVSRSTLYRAYPSKQALLQAVLAREIDLFFANLDAEAAHLPAKECVVECFVRGIAAMRDIPVIGSMASAEPEVMLGAHDGALVGELVTRVVTTLRRSGAQMPDRELRLVAELLLRLASTYLIYPDGALEVRNADAVRDYAERFLSPLVE